MASAHLSGSAAVAVARATGAREAASAATTAATIVERSSSWDGRKDAAG